MTEHYVLAADKVAMRESEAGKNLAKLIKSATQELKKGQVPSFDDDYKAIFQPSMYLAFRDEYRDLLVRVENLSDADPMKVACFRFLEEVLNDGENFDASVVLPLAYQKITPMSAELLYNCADVIGKHGIGGVIYIVMNNFLKEGVRHDVLSKTKEPHSEEERKLIAKIARRYSRFVR